jgi:twitching motility protein PilT
VDKEQLTKLLTFGIQRGVSDAHFTVGHRPHYRVKGDLLPAKHPPLTPEDTIEIARILLENPEWDPMSLQRERDFSYSIPGIGRFRVHIFTQRGSISIIIRVIPYDVRSFEALGLPKVMGDITSARRGLVFIAGATGMGKTTTIAAMIKHINETRHAHIVTIEDPIEFLYPHSKCIITQREVGSDTQSYHDALVASLRQDPDVIMVGEVREHETAEVCLKAAETGHLVISAIHTTDVVKTIERFIGMFPAQEQESVRVRFAESLSSIVSLRLLVNKSGMGRVPAVEILRATRTVREYIRKGDRIAELPTVIEQGRDLYGMQTFDQHLLELYRSGQVKPEVCKAAASNPEDFERAVTFE